MHQSLERTAGHLGRRPHHCSEMVRPGLPVGERCTALHGAGTVEIEFGFLAAKEADVSSIWIHKWALSDVFCRSGLLLAWAKL